MKRRSAKVEMTPEAAAPDLNHPTYLAHMDVDPAARVANIERHFPAELLPQRRWVTYGLIWNPERGTWDKVPFHADGRSSGSSTDERCWGTFRRAADAYLAGRPNGRAGGVGIAMLGSDDVVAPDLDRCYDRARGAFTNDVARALVAEADTYAELSPGGGVHLFGRCAVPWTKVIVDSPMKVELFNRRFFLTVTGDWLPGTPTTLNDITPLVTRLVSTLPDKIDPRVDPRTVALVAAALREPDGEIDDEERAADAQVLRRMFAHPRRGEQDRELWEGDTGTYGGDHSGADLGLCNRLALFCQGDVGQMDRLFRRSGLMREKWDEIHYKEPPATYGQGVIAKAVTWFQGLDDEWISDIEARQRELEDE